MTEEIDFSECTSTLDGHKILSIGPADGTIEGAVWKAAVDNVLDVPILIWFDKDGKSIGREKTVYLKPPMFPDQKDSDKTAAETMINNRKETIGDAIRRGQVNELRTWLVFPQRGDKPHAVKATKHLHDEATGKYIFLQGDTVVASYAEIYIVGRLERGSETSFTPGKVPDFLNDIDLDVG